MEGSDSVSESDLVFARSDRYFIAVPFVYHFCIDVTCKVEVWCYFHNSLFIYFGLQAGIDDALTANDVGHRN